MAIIKKNELKQMNKEQLKEKMNDLRKELLKINTQISTGTTLESPGRVKEIKRTIARLHTYVHKFKLAEVKNKKI